MVGFISRLIPKFGPKPLMVIGLAILGGATMLFSRSPVGGSFTVDVLGASVLAGVGISLTYIPALMTALAASKPEEAGVTSGLVSTSYQVGSAIGLAVMTAIATSASGTNVSLESLNHGYRAAFLGAALMAFLAAASALLFIRRDGTVSTDEAPKAAKPALQAV
jgi:MFS family permease